MIDLQELEQIKRLKYKYLRALDTNQWDLMAECFTEDAVSRYSGGKHSYEGRDAIIKFLSDAMSAPTFLSLHQAHDPEIDLTSPTTATGIWYLQDMIIDLEHKFTLRGAGFYHDEYVKVDGEWKIKLTGYERTFEEMEPRKDVQVLSNMFMHDKAGH